ncbi:hypothetical protein I302_106693 [Kwoniella bestiolae CBS 10118]|uniref:DUF3835 domain-containing protein n=1 Tax=Kwoniella bestiolae CBS 10118 TaxID=1296100 RepID=A0A1B9G0N2_9TREE|nr:hypothetical protein I302_06045 [Kwoniella bestiolae CBS 10118]OCF24584.1 hypothetical protein I302_06045 [Kwoniella bestiolae CBS 10118]
MSSPPQPLTLPILPSSPSLQSHLQALDHLSLRLQHLTSSTTHPVRIPLGSKASILGEVVHTNDIRVNIGAGYWVDMTALEASQYVQRRKERLLEEHARLPEGRARPSVLEGLESGVSAVVGKRKKRLIAPSVGFHQVFHRLPEMESGPSSSISPPEKKQEKDLVKSNEKEEAAPVDVGVKPTHTAEDSEMPNDQSKDNIKSPVAKDENINLASTQNTPQPGKPLDRKGKGTETDKSAASLVELLDDEEGSDAEVGVSGNHGDDTTLNEEGLPIHEIRETLSGETIGPPPPPSTSSGTAAEASVEEKEDDYFSDEAVARRAALRRRLFNEDTSSDEDDIPTKEPIKAKGGIIRSSSSQPDAPSKPSSSVTPLTPPSPPVRERRPSSSLPAPAKSILKPHNPPTRKKSVTFDPSLPSPPASPAPAESLSQMSKRFGFPLPLGVSDEDTKDEGEFSVKPVPVIPAPTPRQRGDGGFAGFKRGFLDRPSSSSTTITPVTTDQTLQERKSQLMANAVQDTVRERGQPPSTVATITPGKSDQKKAFNDPPPTKKQSLFSQRLGQPTIDASAPNIQTTSCRMPNLPKVSESQGTNTIKSGVVEKPPIVQQGVKERLDNLKIHERPGPNGVIMPRKSLIDTTVGRTNYTTNGENHNNTHMQRKDSQGDNDEEEEEDEEFSEYSTGSEDEYDLDQALLAREVALEYHRRQSYKPLNRDPDDPSDDQPEQGEEGEGGVMLGLPRISEYGEPMIINPKPEDLRRFIRVGKLENGNLVLAPGEESLETDDEDQGEEDEEGKGEGAQNKERKERRENRENVMKKLMGLEVSTAQLIEQERKDREEKTVEKGRRRQWEDWERSLPPILGGDTTSITDQVSDRDEAQEDKGSTEEQGSSKEKEKITTKPPVIPLVPESPMSPSLPINTSVPPPPPATATAEVTSTEPVKPKKVSRFKASRMAGN